MYYLGQGVVRDIAEAVAWYRKAAEQGLARAQHSLGFMYERREGVARDDVKAYFWFELSLAGVSWADHSRDRLAKRMTPAQLAEAKKLVQEWLAKH